MKKQIVLDGAQMKDSKGAFQYLARAFKFPAGEKGSLEEVEDLLMSLEQPVDVIWIRHEAMLDTLEELGDEIFETIFTCAQENDKIGLYVARSLFEEE